MAKDTILVAFAIGCFALLCAAIESFPVLTLAATALASAKFFKILLATR